MCAYKTKKKRENNDEETAVWASGIHGLFELVSTPAANESLCQSEDVYPATMIPNIFMRHATVQTHWEPWNLFLLTVVSKSTAALFSMCN